MIIIIIVEKNRAGVVWKAVEMCLRFNINGLSIIKVCVFIAVCYTLLVSGDDCRIYACVFTL